MRKIASIILSVVFVILWTAAAEPNKKISVTDGALSCD